MKNILAKIKAKKYIEHAEAYVAVHLITNEKKATFSLTQGEKYSRSKFDKSNSYDAKKASDIINKYSDCENFSESLEELSKYLNQTFVERMLYHINEKQVKDSLIYKAAYIDKRLYSKMVSDKDYKPSKDTAIAIALALKLSLPEANDLLSRAGYTFSHSNTRDVIIEYCFREKIYDIMIANEILHTFNQKIIGRF